MNQDHAPASDHQEKAIHPFIAEQLVADRRAQLLADAHHSRRVRAPAANRSHAAQQPLWSRWRRRLGVAGLGLVAAIGMLASGRAVSAPDSSPSRLAAETVTLVGFRAVASEEVSYEPGASRTWSPGPQVVAVKVLSGRLTVYGADGEGHAYVAGEAYAAGWAAYRTVNETDERAETLVTSHVRP